MTIPTGVEELIRWLFQLVIIFIVFAVVAYAMDKWVFPRFPEGAKFIGNIILGLLFLVVIVQFLFGIKL